jgi:chromosome segregation ATPase
MALKSKAPVIILAVVILFSLFLTSSFFNLLKKERAENAVLKNELEAVTAKAKEAQGKLEESKTVILDLETKIKETQQTIDALTADLAVEKAAKAEALAITDKIKSELETEKSLKTDLETQLSKANEDITSLSGQIKELESKKKDLETKITDLEAQKAEKVELGRIVIGSDEDQSAQSQDTTAIPEQVTQPKLEGKILVINKEYDFLVMNLGAKEGINVGDIYGVYRQDEYLGDVKVEKVHDSMSAVGFVTPELKNTVKEGDRTVKKTP